MASKKKQSFKYGDKVVVTDDFYGNMEGIIINKGEVKWKQLGFIPRSTVYYQIEATVVDEAGIPERLHLTLQEHEFKHVPAKSTLSVIKDELNDA